MWLYLDDRFVPVEEAAVHVQDRGFRFGDGVFETIGVYAGVPYQWEFHMERLERGLKALGIPFHIGPLVDVCDGLLLRNLMEDGLLRIAVSRGIGSRGYLPLPTCMPTLVVETLE